MNKACNRNYLHQISHYFNNGLAKFTNTYPVIAVQTRKQLQLFTEKTTCFHCKSAIPLVFSDLPQLSFLLLRLTPHLNKNVCACVCLCVHLCAIDVCLCVFVSVFGINIPQICLQRGRVLCSLSPRQHDERRRKSQEILVG